MPGRVVLEDVEPVAVAVVGMELGGIAFGVLAATSANLPGEPDPRRVDDVPAAIREAVGAVVDGGELPGTPSTVVDLTADIPRVLREGAVPADELLARLTDF